MSAEAKKPLGVFAANRQFERFLRVDSNELREDQRERYYPFEKEKFRKQHRRAEVNPEEGKLIATIIYDHENKKVIYDFTDGRHIEE